MRSPISVGMAAGNKMLDSLPPSAQSRAWKAIQASHLALFRAIKPNLSGAEEDKLRASFANIKDWRVNISISSVLIDGGQATVHASRNDTVNGKAVSLHQTFKLTRGASGWTIREIGQ